MSYPDYFDRNELKERFYDEGYDYEAPPDCPWPDCDGGVVGKVEKNYGADRDGNRGIDIHYSECNKCERYPEDFDRDEWKEEKCFDLLREVIVKINTGKIPLTDMSKELEREISEFLEEIGEL